MLFVATGAGGSGKTTVMQKAAEKLGLPFRKSVVRNTMKQFPQIQSEEDLRTMTGQQRLKIQETIFNARLHEELKWKKEGVVSISDRSLVCHMGYVMFWAGAHADDETFNKCKVLARKMANDYARPVFYFPPLELDVRSPDFRMASKAQTHAMDTMVRGTLDIWDMPFIEMVGDIENRVEVVVRTIRHVMERKYDEHHGRQLTG